MAFGIVNAVPQKANEEYIKTSEKNAANGVAGLDASGKLPAARIPAHDNANTTYGAGSGSKYGHVKLSDAIDGTSDKNGGVAATPAAIKAIADALANKAAKNHGHAAADISDLSTVVQSLVSGAAKIQAGSYTGTGTYGASNPCSLTFDFVPLVFFITPPVGFPTYAVPNGQRRIQNNYQTNSEYTVVTWEDHTVKLVADSDSLQFNSNGKQYYYAALG